MARKKFLARLGPKPLTMLQLMSLGLHRSDVESLVKLGYLKASCDGLTGICYYQVTDK